MKDVLILIPAAGSSLRMRGGDKLLEKVGGTAQLARVVAAALDTGQRVLVCLPPSPGDRDTILAPLQCERLHILRIPNPREGMGATLRHAAEQVLTGPPPSGVMVLPADMPDLKSDDIQMITSHFAGEPVRACAEDGRPGHPVILPARMLKAMTQLRGDQGARALLEGEEVTRVPLKGQRALTDLDTPEDWDRWRARTGN